MPWPLPPWEPSRPTHITGSEWMPYEAPSHRPNLSRASAAAQIGAFEGRARGGSG
jgi:hypothetical protein